MGLLSRDDNHPKTIVLISPSGRHEEARAGGNIKPGHLLMRDADGEVVVSTANGTASPAIFAKEEPLLGKTILDSYSEGDLVPYHVAVKGDKMLVRLASGQDVVSGAKLQSVGNGTFDVVASTEVAIVEAAEDMDATEEEKFIRVWVL